jgi:CheY-like chemotaxis protein
MTTPKWILLAEDNGHDADLAVRALAAGDSCAEVVVTEDGAVALDCLRRRGEYLHHTRGDPALVLLDLKMSKVDGFQVLEQIKSDAQLKQIPVVIFSSSREERDIVRCYQLGANAYVVKPMDFRHYVTALKDVLRFWIITNELAPVVRSQETSAAAKRQPHWV